MENNKSPGNNELMKEFYFTFWNEVKAPLLLAIEKAYLIKELSTLQKQAAIKLIKKKRMQQNVYSKLATYFLT